VLREDADARVQRLFPESTAEFFQALRVRVFGRYELPAGYAVLVIESGAGEMRCEGDRCQIHRGETWVVPHGAGPLTITGDVRLLVCLPPAVSVDGQ
jgi:mannose-6-phosphate isomerase